VPDHENGGEVADRRAARQQIAVHVLGRGGSYGDAGEEAEVDRRTIGRWMRDPEFRRRVQERREEWVAEIAGQLVAAGPDAVTVLVQESRIAPLASDRIRAATALLSHSQRFRRDHGFHERLRAIEEDLGLVGSGDEKSHTAAVDNDPDHGGTTDGP
jgi:hypothetical protein